jgi:hypothetical protein
MPSSCAVLRQRSSGQSAGSAPTLPKARGVGEQPEGGEIRIEAFVEDGFEVGLDVGRPGETGVVAQDAQLEAVADHGPQQAWLALRYSWASRKGERRRTPSPWRLLGLSSGLVVRGEDERHAALARGKADGEAAFAEGDLADHA